MTLSKTVRLMLGNTRVEVSLELVIDGRELRAKGRTATPQPSTLPVV